MNINTNPYPKDIIRDTTFIKIYEKCKPFTMTSIERSYALYKSCKYIINNNIKGDFVECGVWKGGSVMIIAYTLLSLNITNRKIYLYDTFEGMSKPESIDLDINNRSAKSFLECDKDKKGPVWGYATKEEVKNNLFTTDYPKSNIYFIVGKVEDTIPGTVPDKISLLRLDTDWYSSTLHELVYLYPYLVHSGVLIIDDYGHWAGARKAVNEYFKKFKNVPFIHRIDYTGRILIKL